MKAYTNLLSEVVNHGVRQPNRTGIDTLMVPGAHLQFDLRDGFPVVAERMTPWRSAIAEQVGFIRAYDNANDFEKLGCKFWRANAEAPAWISSVHHNGTDGDLGRIYGVQARDWVGGHHTTTSKGNITVHLNTQHDQLAQVYREIGTNPTSRRLLVSHWRPDEFDRMALPPCHVLYQFICDTVNNHMHLSVYFRSNDLVLGTPSNIVEYAWLLYVTAHAFGYTPVRLNYFISDAHVYVNHLDGVNELLRRPVVDALPTLGWAAVPPAPSQGSEILWLENLEPKMFDLVGYEPFPAIKFDMAV